MTLRAAPGPQLAAGRLRVDAARAIAKLREYQLVDRTAWVLEAIRAAVASGATRVSLDGDANDVWLRWEGPAWSADELPRLFDELVSPEPARTSQHLRLLAAAVNSALGMRPAFVDLFAIAEDGAARRVRYTPDVLEEAELGDLGDAPLRELEIEDVAAPPDAPRPGMVVHLRRRAGLETLGLLFKSGPPELALASRACAELAVPMRIRAEELGRHAPGHDVVRVPLGQDLGGWIAITDLDDGDTPGATLAIAEHGVVLARYASELVVTSATVPVPARLYVDAPRMPTNASRSEVRLQGHPIAAAEVRARELVPALLTQLATDLTARPDDERLRRAALALIASAVHGADWWWKLNELTGGMRALAALPLVHNAVGARCPVVGPWRPGGVHVGDEPFPEELARWLGQVLWAPPGDPAERLIAGAAIDRRAVRKEARQARRQLRAERRFERHAKRPARLTAAAALVTLRIGTRVEGTCVPDDVVADLDGEVGLFAHESWRGELALLLDGRDIEVISSTSPIAFTAIADSRKLTPDPRYHGVVRDAELDRVERAVRGALIRGAEVLARHLGGGEPPDGARLGDAVGRDPEAVRAVVRRAIALAHTLGFPIGASASPLGECVAWVTATGDRVRLAELRGQRAIGVTAPGSGFLPPTGRVVLAADKADVDLLGAVLDVRIVDYDRRVGTRSLDRAVDLARALIRTTRVALVIREPGIAAALGPAPVPMVTLHHAGVELASASYPFVLYPCAIAIDADAVVPDLLWTTVVDDGGVGARDHTPWEHALVRAIASALCGRAAPDLIAAVPPRIDDDHGGKLLCAALVRDEGGPALLGAEIAAALRAAPILHVLGGALPVSIDALAAAHPSLILWVPPGTAPVAGDDYQPLVATAHVAQAVGSLAGIPVDNGLFELARRRDLKVRALRRAAHRAQPVQPLILQDAPASVEAAGGLVGVGRDELVVVFRVEGRPFQRITRAGDLPLVAAIEVPDQALDAAYAVVVEPAIERYLGEVRAAAAPLLVEIAKSTPTALADDPRILALLTAWLVQAGTEWQALQALRVTEAWQTVQGDRVSVLAAVRGDRVQLAAWDGEWLPAGDGEPAHALDSPVLVVRDQPGDLLRVAIAHLEPRAVDDVTDAVRGLQARRRMARGLLAPPSIPAVNPALRRPLAALGEPGRALGAGEIALSLEAESTLFLHREGTIAARATLTGVSPPVEVAIERPELASAVQVLGSLDEATQEELRALIRPAAAALARELAIEHPGDWLAPTIRGHLRRAVLGQWLTHDHVGEVAVLQSTDGRWWRWAELEAQRARFGDPWWAGLDDARVPLTEGRLAFRLTEAEVEGAKVLGIALLDARDELALDEEARRNLARRPVTALEPTFEERARVLAVAPLRGDGVTGLRGLVAPLSPQHASKRRVRAHRGMHPFDPVDDPCPWPTLAIVDDVRLSGDRTFSVPVGDGVWLEAASAIREASEHALRSLVPIAEHALASRWIGPELFGGYSPYPASPDFQIRGALWLIEPTDRGVIVVERPGATLPLPVEGAPMAGRLYVHATARLDTEDRLREVAKRIYALLLADAQAKLAEAPALVTAHLARGIAAGALEPEDVREARFPCFRPHPYDGLQLGGLLRGLGTIDVLAPGADGVGLVDDGTSLSKVILHALGARALRPRPAPMVAEPAPARLPGLPPPYVPPADTAVPRHELDDLASAVERMLGDVGVLMPVTVAIGRRGPLMRVTRKLELAGEHPLLSAIDARRRRGGPDARIVVEALAAHALTVLNHELHEVNDVTEAFALARLLG